ncbi:MAG TPA: DUF1800 domain-containing protein [Pirellulales bacterium]|jgi:uncharacterized protein (DUF1800 family)|nr:DUF1800 domain-containing protein [Pirellulales bacterium]
MRIKTMSIDLSWAWQPYRPDDENPWDLKKAGHLYRRAAFGANVRQLDDAVAAGPEKTIAALLSGGAGIEAFNRQVADMAGSLDLNSEEELRAWWLYRILQSPFPLQVRLTLFWHNHFATSNAKVRNLRFMLGQNELLRRNALGSFRTMLEEISKDPAMMVWLDTSLSKKGTPNENYSRELMELFSLGIGNYTEQDVREGARAFTGWQIADGKFHLNGGQHDNGEKTFLGQQGNWGGEDIVRICLEQEAAPYFIAGKLFRFFISDTIEPTRELLKPLAGRFRESDYDLRGLVETLLRSNLFFSPHAYRTQVKSPVDFAVGIVHGLEGHVGAAPLAVALEGLGQRLFSPPSVKGWLGGTTWINSTTLLLRHNLALALTSTQDNRFTRVQIDPVTVVRKYGKKTDEQIVDFFVQLFLQNDLAADARSSLLDYLANARKQPYPDYWTDQDQEEHRIRAVCHLLLTQAEFQLN